LLPNKELIKNVSDLWEITESHFVDRRDLESFLTLLKMLEDPEEYKLLTTSYKKLQKIKAHNIETIKTVTQKYIRTKLENIVNIKYLENARGFHYPLNIFTLNYDSVLDVFCETYDIRYTDGFDPYWNPELFSEEKEGFQVKLYRLHGSLYWLKTSSGKTLKIPIKGLDIPKQRYISDESLSEMIIYPTFQKDKYSEIYS
jgi:DNA mismatch repair ATPase MutS